MSRYLTNYQRRELLQAQRIEVEAKYQDRIRCLLYRSKGYDYEEIAELLFCDARTVRRWESRFFEGGISALLSEDRGGSNSRLTEEQLEELEKELGKRLYRTAKDISTLIKFRYGVQYSISGTHLLLSTLGFVYKKPKVVPSKGKIEDQVEFLDELDEIKATKAAYDKIYYTDGVHPQFSTSASSGWIKRGTDVELPAQTGRQKLHLHGALDADTHEVIVSEHKTLNAQAFIAFLTLLLTKNPYAKSIYVVLDNARYHRNKEVKNFVKRTRIKLLFLPPYSPNINLIERIWGFLKRMILYNRTYSSFREFKAAVLEFLDGIHIKYHAELDSLLQENYRFFKASTT